MTRYLRMVELDDGWSEWVHPLPGYKMSCCECGLVHNMQFKIVEKGRIIFRAQRNSRATAAVRREKKKAAVK